MKRKIAVVKWVDHCMSESMSLTEWAAFTPAVRTAVGFVLADTDDRIVLVMDITDGHGYYGFTIDRRLVKSIRYIR